MSETRKMKIEKTIQIKRDGEKKRERRGRKEIPTRQRWIRVKKRKRERQREKERKRKEGRCAKRRENLGKEGEKAGIVAPCLA